MDDSESQCGRRIYPLSALQRGVWLEYRLDPFHPKYNTASGCRVRGPLDAERMIAAWQSVVDRHPQLRARFGSHESGPYYEVTEAGLPGAIAPTVVHDATSLSLEEAGVIARREIGVPFDLERDLGERLILIRLADDDWLLVVVIHHVICDLGSADIVFDELAAAYAGDARPREPIEPARTYDAFTTWHEALLGGERGAVQAEYWRRTLADAPATLALPVDRLPEPGKNVGACHPWMVLDAVETKGLTDLCAAIDTSAFRFLLTVFETLLHRMTGESDLVVGTAADCRPPELAGVVGNFVNMIVVRTILSPNCTFRELLGQVRERVKEGLQHKEYPFGSVVRAASGEQSSGTHSFYRTSFALLRMRRRPSFSGMMLSESPVPWHADFGGLAIEPGPPLPQQQGIHDLTLWMAEVNGALVGEFKYNTKLFDPPTIERLTRYFGRLLRSAMASFDSPLSDLELLQPTELQQIVFEWNRTKVAYPNDIGAHRAIETWAARTPDRIALRYEDRTLTYAELDSRAGAAARHLVALGVVPGDIVGILLPRSIETVVSIVGILKSGAAFLPLEPTYPTDRLSVMVDDSRPAAVITTTDLCHALPVEVPRLLLDAVENDANEAVLPDVAGDAAAYVIYTSGSSGVPKGVVLHHRGLCNLSWGLRDAWQIDESSHVLCFATFNFDGAVASLFPALFAGAAVHLGDRDATHGGVALHRLMATEAITHATLPPTIWSALPRAPLPALAWAVSAGEACPREVVDAWAPGRTFVNGYGPTEATVCATLGVCEADRPITIGRPFANTRIYILDAQRSPVPIGARGEIWIGGVGVATGYLNRDELTRERFAPDPFVPGERVYRTGDFGRFLPDGQIQFLGRRDDQVKLRGLRIELGEIESALQTLPEVRDAVAVVRDVGNTGKRLVAYVTGPVGEHASTALRTELARHLPEFMLPTQIVVLDSLPLTINGKVDKNRLPLPVAAASRAPSDPPVRQASSTLEDRVASVWKSVLGLSRVEPNENFFELGGDSLLALELAEALSSALGCDVLPSVIFEAPILAQMCESLATSAPLPSLVTLHGADSAKAPLFFLHPAGGESTIYRPLGERLRPSRKLIGVQSRALRNPAAEHGSIAEMAAAYASELEAAQRDGAFCLLGWSMGGILAVAVAAELEARGRSVALIGVWDSHLATTFAEGGTPFERVAPDLGPVAGLLLERLSVHELDAFGTEVIGLDAAGRVERALERARSAGVEAGALGQLASQAALHAVHRKLLAGYVPPRVRAPIHGWWAEASLAAGQSIAAWHSFTSSLSVRTVPGNHFSIWKGTTLDRLAVELDRVLQESEAGTSSRRSDESFVRPL